MSLIPTHTFIFSLLFLFCSSTTVFAANVQRMSHCMGTFLVIETQASSTEWAEKNIEDALEEISSWDQRLSNYKPYSEIEEVNRLAAVQEVQVSTETYLFLKEGKDYFSLTNRCFDLTIGSLSQLWHLQSRKLQNWPDQSKITDAKNNVGSDFLELNSSSYTVKFLKKNMRLDTGGIGKGYALDRAWEKVKLNSQRATFNFGGEILDAATFVESNNKPGDLSRRIRFSVRHPFNPKSIWGDFEFMTDWPTAGISTSGNYERFVTLRSTRTNTNESNALKKIGHILDPRTGYPVNNSIESVTVISKSATRADVFSTAIFVMGLEPAKNWLENFTEDAVLILYRDGEKLFAYRNKNWENWIQEIR